MKNPMENQHEILLIPMEHMINNTSRWPCGGSAKRCSSPGITPSGSLPSRLASWEMQRWPRVSRDSKEPKQQNIMCLMVISLDLMYFNGGLMDFDGIK